MAVQEKLYSVEDFLQIAMRPENENKRLELVDGVIHEKGEPPDMVLRKINTLLTGILVYYLNAFVLPRKLGIVTAPDGGFRLGPRTLRMPDAGFLSTERAGDLTDVIFPVAPDLAIEIISPSESPRSVRRKTREYLRAGSRLVWNVYPEEREVDVCTVSEKGIIQSQTL
jgi:Uma2 family endonuclease